MTGLGASLFFCFCLPILCVRSISLMCTSTPSFSLNINRTAISVFSCVDTSLVYSDTFSLGGSAFLIPFISRQFLLEYCSSSSILLSKLEIVSCMQMFSFFSVTLFSSFVARSSDCHIDLRLTELRISTLAVPSP